MDSYCRVVEGRLMSKLLERFSLVTLGRQKRKSCNLFSLLCDRLISVSEGQKPMSLLTKGSLDFVKYFKLLSPALSVYRDGRRHRHNGRSVNLL